MEIFILIFVMVTLLVLVAVFWLQNKLLKKKYDLQNKELRYKFYCHRDQLIQRESNLKKYNFLKFNLSEALIFQKFLNLGTN